MGNILTVAWELGDIFGHPFPIRFVIKDIFKIQLIEWNFPDGISGIYLKVDGIPHVGINVMDDHRYPKRTNFTMAHELCHHLFHQNTSHLCKTSRFTNKKTTLEYQADLFAAELLMPEAKLKSYIKDLNFLELCDKFRVSRKAMRVRLSYLNLAAN